MAAHDLQIFTIASIRSPNKVIESVWATSYAVDGHMGAPLHCYTFAGGSWILGNWGKVKPKWRCCACHGWGCKITDCIPHLYWMYRKWLSTFICSRRQLVVVFLSKARWGGIRRVVVRSPAVVVARRADARAKTPTRGRFWKGVGVSICTAEGVFPRDLSRGRMICRRRRKNTMIYHFLCLHASYFPGSQSSKWRGTSAHLFFRFQKKLAGTWTVDPLLRGNRLSSLLIVHRWSNAKSPPNSRFSVRLELYRVSHSCAWITNIWTSAMWGIECKKIC
jgi:hypothetical protein